MVNDVGINIEFMISTNNPDKIEWIREVIFNILSNEEKY